MEGKRVVITGMGTVNPMGNSVAETWKSILAGDSGIGPIIRFDASHLPTRFAGEVKNLDAASFFPENLNKLAKRSDLFCQFAVAAAHEAAIQAGIETVTAKHRIGVCIGSGIGGINVQNENSINLKTKGSRGVSPFYIPMSIGNMASGIVSMIYGVTGPNLSLQTACATANHAIAMGRLLIRDGSADIMIVGGTEGSINELSVTGFSNMHALSKRNDSPRTASRPYDQDRDGFVMSEGAAVLILEDYDHARQRKAEILCEVLACGMSGDAYDVVAPDPTGRGALLSMSMALNQAGLAAEDIGYINAHGTSTPVGDDAELRGIWELIKDHPTRTLVSSTKGYHGHLLGATAGLEAIIAAMALRENTVPANLNLVNRDPQLPPVVLPTETVHAPLKAVLSNSFGFGGHNSSLILSKVG